MYKHRHGQRSLLESPEMFMMSPLNSENEWIKLAKLIPWDEIEKKYAKNFKSKKGQRAYSARMALGALIIKERYRSSDEDTVNEIAMNPYLQYFLGLPEYQNEAPFDASMLTRFRQRITPDMLKWANDKITETKKDKEKDTGATHTDKDNKTDGEEDIAEAAEAKNQPEDESLKNKGTMILDATCAPQNIRFPTDVSLVNEARKNSEMIIDYYHKAHMTEGEMKPRTYRKKAKKAYDSFSKSRKKPLRKIRQALKSQLRFLKRDIRIMDEIEARNPESRKVLPKWLQERCGTIRKLYAQQEEMLVNKTNRVADRIVSLSQPWVRPIKRGKQNAETEFGAKAEMSVVNGFLRVEEIRWNAYNESTTLKDSVEGYKERYGYYPERILADKIFRTRDNIRYCASKGIHLNGSVLGKPPSDPEEQKRQKRLEWEESGERGEIERDFGVCKRRYSLGKIMTKLKETSETAIMLSVLVYNLWKKLRLLLSQISDVFKTLNWCSLVKVFFVAENFA